MELLKYNVTKNCKLFFIPDFINDVTSLAALIELINSSCFLFQSRLDCVHVNYVTNEYIGT